MSAPRPRPRVLLGNLEPMVRLGMSRVLTDGGVEVVPEGDPATSIVAEAERLAPDAVVLGLDANASHELGARVRAAAPSTKVILWSRDETEMQVFDPGSTTPRRIFTAVPDALLGEVTQPKPARQGE